MEAPLWGESLALADPYAILPVTTSLLILTNVELYGTVDAATEVPGPRKMHPVRTLFSVTLTGE